MFCSNCGKEASGKFCSNCGSPLASEVDNNSDAVAEINTDSFIYVNGLNVNISEIIRLCGKDKINAIKILRDRTGVSLSEGKSIIDNAYNELYPKEPKKGFWQKAKEEAAKQREQELENKQYEKERLAQLDRDGVAYCPKCHSTSLSAQKKGFGIGKAVVGAALTGGIGLVAGNIGAKKVRVTCLKCGHQFMA